MSLHWKPDEDLARCIAADELAREQRRWPEGATAGLLLVAFSCVALGAALYQFTSPRDPVEASVARR
ncbi:MAG TPA: hypothetical protein VNJ05_03645 [Sphingomicrobium sp.]|nr:hypothetical protein [Sphingomicrobium sp.]